MNEHIVTLFGSKDGGPHSNLWIEGQRLRDAGFPPGEEYQQVWFKDRVVIAKLLTGEHDDIIATFTRKVAHRKGRPTIRIEGKRVGDVFKGFRSVKVDYEKGCVIVTGHDPIVVKVAA